ncbi:UxaA family hydrolase [Dysosmobacter sp.]|jgi:altronate dehydratase large subunit|uniref:UxaA family hydrolase n=1 Tax=Dysosmobacter sp. TaxID=2591382 RepID=UPI003D8E17D4
MEFYGYRRPDGAVGIRNHVLILPASVCASDTASFVCRKVSGTVTFHNQSGCGQTAPDQQMTMDMMSGFAANPNVYGTVVISLGCENCQMDMVVAAIQQRTNKPLRTVIIQEVGGTDRAIEIASKYASELVDEAAKVQRTSCDISELILGTECGGSDPTSGLAANPVLGLVCDKLIDMGGTAILSETTEFIGAEHILASRARTDEVKKRLYQIIQRFEKNLAFVGEEVRDSNPSPGNIAGGITTLEEKSLGCIHKGGHRMIEAVYDYGTPVTQKGLVIMDTAGHDPSSVAGMAAGGCQVVVFTTGCGTPTGNPIVPVIKITGNRKTYHKMNVNMDFDTSPLIYGEKSGDQLSDELLQLVVDVANGQQPLAEQKGFIEISIDRVSCFT